MRIAALYDVHANLPALEAVLAEVERERVDAVVFGGDAVLGPMPRETLDRMRALRVPLHCIRGNCDRAVLEQAAGQPLTALPETVLLNVQWVAGELDAGALRWLAAWPPTLRLDLAGLGPVLFCHATPRDDTGIFTRVTAEERLLPVFADAGTALVVCGHTHMQFDRRVGAVRVINAGSVGMPFGRPGADWLLLGPQPELRHTDYDLAAAAARVRATRYPDAREFAARDILQPRPEADVLALYSRAELRA